MLTFITILHIIFCLLLIGLVLIQDSKGNGAFGMGGTANSSSFLGATGAQTLASKLTVWISVLLAGTCLGLSMMSTKGSRSVVDQLPAALPAATAPLNNNVQDSSQQALPGDTNSQKLPNSGAETAKDKK